MTTKNEAAEPATEAGLREVLRRTHAHFYNHMEGCQGPYTNEDADVLEAALNAVEREARVPAPLDVERAIEAERERILRVITQLRDKTENGLWIVDLDGVRALVEGTPIPDRSFQERVGPPSTDPAPDDE